MHGSICKYQYANQTNALLTDLDSNEIKIINQIAFTTTQVEIIKLENAYNNLLIPIYPISISAKKLNNRFKFLDNNDLVSLDKYININTILKTKLLQYNYRISKIYYDDFENKINSIQFTNNLIIPIQPMNYTIENKRKIINMMIEAGELKNNEDIRITGLFKPIYFNFELEINPVKDILNIRNNIYKDFIYNLRYVLPCKYCRINLTNNLKQKPLLMCHMKSRATFSRYIYELHEIVNTMLGKQSGLSYEDVRQRYETFRARCIEKETKINKNLCKNNTLPRSTATLNLA